MKDMEEIEKVINELCDKLRLNNEKEPHKKEEIERVIEDMKEGNSFIYVSKKYTCMYSNISGIFTYITALISSLRKESSLSDEEIDENIEKAIKLSKLNTDELLVEALKSTKEILKTLTEDDKTEE